MNVMAIYRQPFTCQFATIHSENQTGVFHMAGIIAVVTVTTVVVLVLIRAAKQTKEPSTLDLRSVRDAMIEKQGWTEERANAAQFEYVRFLILLQKKPGFMLVPWLDSNGRDDLDQFWHQHILDTEKYAADCKALFGRMIHHNPNVLRGSREEGDAIEKTRRLYTRTFSSGTYGSNADPADFSGCSACAAGSTDSCSHSDASHSHDGGGDGQSGHSCGGSHGCGGHGCGGHGCGGGH
jgi:uncharacterized membrane protein YgcG